jgi:hypothetical protein
MAEPYGWDDPREKPETDERRRGLLREPDEVPSPRILKIALVAAAIIVVIALILYFKARNAPPALRSGLRAAPTALRACNISPRATSNRQS